MKKNISKISYDKKSGVLSIEIKRAKSSDSDIRGNVVIDYDKNGEIVRINFYDFSFDSFKDSQRPLKEFSRDLKTPLSVR
ncbi:MAG TPA: DUF2283 domain-containing protein [Candidatus Paceibacterota bacterium]